MIKTGKILLVIFLITWFTFLKQAAAAFLALVEVAFEVAEVGWVVLMRVLFFISKALKKARLIFLMGVRFIKSEALKEAQLIFLIGVTFIKLKALKKV